MSAAADTWRRTEAIFHEALACAEPERTRLLDERCGTDTALRAELQALLAACEAEERHRVQAGARPEVDAARHLGPYEVDRLLGRGGMGAVYLAHRDDGQFEQQVAIKIIDMPLATETFRERFRNERQILASLNHAYIARLLDGGVTQSGELYLAMEYVDGKPITAFADEHGLTTEARLRLFLKVLEAVQYAHGNLVVHRDLKPDNILVSEDGHPHLLDFGTAKLLSPTEDNDDLTQTGMRAFTPRYASPEQVLGQPITIASDIYSLGVLLFHLLTGAMPYKLKNASTGELVEVICQQPPARPSAHGAVDGDLDAIVLKALRKEPAERYATVQQFAADLEAQLAHRPVAARRGNRSYRAGKWMRRNRGLFAAAVLVAISLTAGVAGTLWQSRQANLERRRAEARSDDLRQLSNSLLNELNDALKDIPGSTGAQKLMVTRVIEHLDRMGNDAHGNRETALDLCRAYTRLGNVQGNGYYQNLADTPGAVASFDKAIGFARQVTDAHPHDTEALRLLAAALEAKGEALSDADQAQAAGASLKAAVDTYEKLVGLPGAKPDLLFETAIAWETLGSQLGEDSGLADAAGALVAYRHALAMDEQVLRMQPDYWAVRRGVPLMYVHLGNVVVDTDPADALAQFQHAVAIQQALPADQRQRLPQRRLSATLPRKMAEAYAELGDYASAQKSYAESLAGYEELAREDAKNVGALADVERVLNQQASAYAYAVDPMLQAAADPALRRANLKGLLQVLDHDIAVVRQLIAQDPAHEHWQPRLAAATVQREWVRRQLDPAAAAGADVAESLATLQRFAERPQVTAEEIGLATSSLLIAEPRTLRDPGRAVSWALHGVELTHHRSPDFLLQLAQAQQAAGQMQEARATAQQGLALLPAVAAGVPESRLRRLLEAVAAANVLRAGP